MIDFKRVQNIHFIGIGGVSMHQLAEFCLSLGWTVTGSDLVKNKYIKKLQKKCTIFLSHNRSNILSPNIVVKSGAIKDDNPEIIYAKSLGIKIYDRAEFLGEVTRHFNTVIAIAGSHGKSSTCSMLYQILKASNRKVSCHIGADIENAHFDYNDDILIVEACEYNKSFLKLKVDIGAILNIEKDHLDCYGGIWQLKNAFKTFLKHSKLRYVLKSENTEFLNLKNIKFIDVPKINSNKFEVDGTIYEINSNIGKQYIFDAILAISICRDLGVAPKIIQDVLLKFNPPLRRNQKIGKYKDKDVIIDYAHHPTEIKYVSENYIDENPIFIFQPHTYSRTKYLKKEFVEVLKNLNVIIFKEYSAREKPNSGLTAHDLYLSVKEENAKCFYADDLSSLMQLLKITNYNKLIFLGAGDIDLIAKQIVNSKN